MNCQPNQLAWICVPQAYHGSGVEHMHGRVVRTIRPATIRDVPSWFIDPPQRVTLRWFGHDCNGVTYRPGDNAVFETTPDAWLRPFDPASLPELPATPEILALPVIEQTV